jgi:hypothetical protein
MRYLPYVNVSSRTCTVQAHATIPDDAWEYHIRKSLKDAAYKGLDYVPYNTTMPLTPQSENVRFIWVSAGASPVTMQEEAHRGWLHSHYTSHAS